MTSCSGIEHNVERSGEDGVETREEGVARRSRNGDVKQQAEQLDVAPWRISHLRHCGALSPVDAPAPKIMMVMTTMMASVFAKLHLKKIEQDACTHTYILSSVSFLKFY